MSLHADEGHGMAAGQRHLAHPADMLDRETARGAREHPDDVDAYLVEEHAVRDHPANRQPPEPAPLLPGDRLDRRPEPGPGARLHLADDQDPALGGDDV